MCNKKLHQYDYCAAFLIVQPQRISLNLAYCKFIQRPEKDKGLFNLILTQVKYHIAHDKH
ncbi:hypothetical protein GCM10009411_23670 [Shewanella litoralis]|uniref:Uncharacterized protein n=1 Tax=Shewanella litoralis TaxID=2282700 RepID=A0ABQ2REG4_9GAMM|nr:hypothetical protein GCM10009411_23670 [Shewanella litoralis]